MRTLFNGKNNPQRTNKSKPRVRYNFRTNYILSAVTSVKEHIDKDPFKFKLSSDILNFLNTPNRRLLEKAFREEYGDGIKTYQVKVRLNAGKVLMMEGMPKKLVAHRCYYSSQSAFTTAFKRQFGMTPTEWEHSGRHHGNIFRLSQQL